MIGKYLTYSNIDRKQTWDILLNYDGIESMIPPLMENFNQISLR